MKNALKHCGAAAFCTLFLALLLLLPAGTARASSPEERKLTLMIYMCGSNLESGYGSASADILEMIANAPEDRNVTVLVMTGGTARWSLGFDAASASIHEISSHGIRTIWPAAGETAARNMGDPDTLTFFLEFGAERYPAEDYALILWDHGGGPMTGVCWDELFSMDNLSLNDVADAIDRCGSNLRGRLSWIGFDACLMGSFEVACTLSGYADYMIASQETEPASGWNYAFLRDLGSDADGAATGRRIVDAYFEGQEDSRDFLTLACLDLRQISPLRQAVNAFFTPLALNIDETAFPRISGLRLQSAGFGKADVGGESDYDLVDLNDLISRLDPGRTGAVTDALVDMVVYSRSNVEGAAGVSIYHPYHNKRKYVESWHDSYRQIKSSQGYADYIFRFGSLLTAGETVDWSGLRAVHEGDGVFTCALTGDQAEYFVSARLLILQPGIGNDGVSDTYTLIGDCPAVLTEDGTVRAEYHGRTLYAVAPDREEENFTGPLTWYQASGRAYGVMPALYQPRETAYLEDMEQAIVFFEIPSLEEETEAPIRLVRLYDPVTESFSSRVEFRPEDYSVLWFKTVQQAFPANSDNGTLPAYADWPDDRNIIQWLGQELDENWYLYFFDHQLSGDPLIALFEITDARQNSFCSSPAPVEHPGITPVTMASDLYEDDRIRLELSGEVVHTEIDRFFRLYLRMTNRSGKEMQIYLRDVSLNDSRAVSGAFTATLAAGETRTDDLVIDARELEGLREITALSGTLVMNPPSVYEERTEDPVRFTFAEADVSAIAPAGSCLAETTAEGITWRLLEAAPDDDGDLKLLMQVINGSDSDLKLGSGTALALNHIQLETSLYETIPAGGESILSLTLKDAVLLDFMDRVDVQDLVDFFRPLVLSQGILANHGQTEIGELTIGVYDYDLHGFTAGMTLSEPIRIPAFTPRNQNTRWYGALPAASTELRSLPLLDWPDLGVSLERILVGDNGFVAVLDLENRSERPLNLTCSPAEINGLDTSDVYMEEDFFLLPGCTLTTSMPVTLEEIPLEGSDLTGFALKLTGLTVLTDPVLRVSFRFPAPLGAAGGTVLESADVTAEMPPAPVRYDSAIPAGVVFRAVEIQYESAELEGKWFDYSDAGYTLLLRPDGRAEECQYGNTNTRWVWSAREDGSVILRNTFFEQYYTLGIEDGAFILNDPGFGRYKLEPAEE